MSPDRPVSRPVLYGFPPSTFTRTAALALLEKGVAFEFSAIDTRDEPYGRIHPFRKVPALKVGDTVIIETLAIGVYVDETFEGPPLQPGGHDRYVMFECISAFVDYFRQALVRGVINEAFIKPMMEQPVDEARLASYLKETDRLIGILDRRMGQDAFLAGPDLSLADLFFAPPLDYLSQFPDGSRVLARHAHVARWHERMLARPAYRQVAQLGEE